MLTAMLFVAAVGLVGCSLTTSALAQQPLEMPTLLNPANMGPVRFRLVSGRVTMSGLRLGSYSTASSSRGRSERLTFSAPNNQPAMSYESTSAAERLSIEATGSRLQIRRLPQDDSGVVPVEFEQAPAGPLVLSVGPKEQRQVYRAASLWHLLIAHREVCQQHLVPLLRLLHREWDLGKMLQEVEAILLSPAAGRDLPDRRRWAALVEQLGDSRFSEREAADRQLREAGRAVVPYLRQLDSSRLDAEQRYRIRRILAALEETDDLQSPEQVAAWLSGDPAIWLSYMAHDDEPARRLAASRLESLLGKPVCFDPAADPATRARQLEKIRKQLGAS